jgi:hypothetical protein
MVIMIYHIFQLLIIGFDMRSREIVEHYDADEDADQASRETKDPRYDADNLEDHSDGSSP